MARSRYIEAAKVAIILANNEQVKGNFFIEYWRNLCTIWKMF